MPNKLTALLSGAVLFAAVAPLASHTASAGAFRVSQESVAGLGDFDANVLGMVDAFNTGLTAAGYYQYDVPDAASYNGQLNGGPAPVSNVTQVFLVDAADGLSLFVVHDNPNDGSGGSTRTRWNLAGGDTAAALLLDDPGEGFVTSLGGTQFDSTKTWTACCTDGYVIGSLDGMFQLFGGFVTAPVGISNWSVVDSDFSTIPLTLSTGRRVRIDRFAQVSEPGTLALFGLGLAGIGVAARRMRKAA